MSHEPVTVLVTNNFTTPFSFDLTPVARRKRWSTVKPGGCGDCTFEIPIPAGEYLTVPPYLGAGYKVELLDGGEVFWSGRLAAAKISKRRRGGRVWQVTARGWAVSLTDQYYTTQNVAGTETSVIVSNALSALAPDILATSISATGFTLSGATAITLQLMHALAVVAWAARYGTVTTFDPQTFLVYPDADGTVRFTFADRQSTAPVEVAEADFAESEFGFDERGAANRIVVRYNGGASYVTVNDTTLQGAGPDGFGFIKTLAYVLGEITQSADATQAANALLTAAKAIRMAASGPFSVVCGEAFPMMIDTGTGQQVEPWRLRAGQLMRLTDVSPAEGADTNLAFLNSFEVAGTDYDEETGQLSIIPESYDQFLERSTAMALALLQGRISL